MWPFSLFRKSPPKPKRRIPVNQKVTVGNLSAAKPAETDNNANDVIDIALSMAMYNAMTPETPAHNVSHGWGGDGSYTYPSDTCSSSDSGSSSYDSGSSSSDSGSCSSSE